jgi:glycosyltransferase involved in cell wall biosynthesis
MKVLHVPFCYYPDPVGGTEVYTGALAACQAKLGLTVAIAAPASENAEYFHDGIPVHRFRISASLPLGDLYGEGDPAAAEAFGEILRKMAPDIVHLHAFTSGVSLRLVRAARRANVSVVFTYHTPTVTCDRGTLLLWGSEICDGIMDVHRCARCGLHALGLPKPASWLIGSLPSSAAEALGAAGLSGGAWTALRMTELSRLRRRAASALFAESSRVVAVCEWVKELLQRNGVPEEKIALCRQGLAHPPRARETQPKATGLPLRIAFLGRLDAVKGLDILLDALQLAPDLPIALDIFAVSQSDIARRLKTALLARTGHDPRVTFHEPIAPHLVVERLLAYDALAVPSRWMETGPMVVYEAFAAGTPVVGSRLGGIAELVEHEKNGLLVAEPTAPAWAAALQRLVREPALLPALKRGIGPVRTMQDVAGEMRPVYESAIRQAGELVH